MTEYGDIFYKWKTKIFCIKVWPILRRFVFELLVGLFLLRNNNNIWQSHKLFKKWCYLISVFAATHLIGCENAERMRHDTDKEEASKYRSPNYSLKTATKHNLKIVRKSMQISAILSINSPFYYTLHAFH